MPLEQTFRDLHGHLLQLRDALIDVRVAIVEDRPLTGELVLVDVLGDSVDALHGWVEEALAAAAGARQAAVQPVNLTQVRQALVACQAQFQCFQQRCAADLVAYERMAELERAARERGSAWRAWAQSVRRGLDEVQRHATATGQALFLCWQELGERIGATSISVSAASTFNTVNPGQLLTLGNGEAGRQAG